MTTPAEIWRAPRATAPVRGIVQVPGSKSITNRALILAALSDSSSSIVHPLQARDTTAMVNGLRALGHDVSSVGTNLLIEPRLGAEIGAATIDCDQAGTVMRFLPPVACLTHGDITFDAHVTARTRPMTPVLEALRSLGAQLGDENYLPFTMRSTGHLLGGHVTLDASHSSQFVTALLMIAARTEQGISIEHQSATGADVPSLPHIEMTCAMLAAHGVHVDSGVSDGRRSWHVAASSLAAHDWNIEPDLSNALPFLAAAAVTAGEVRIPGLGASTLQPLIQVGSVLRQLGCTVEIAEADLVLTGPDKVTGVDVDLSAIAETAVTFAAICAHAKTPSRLHGIGHIRGHETDRVSAILTMLRAVGCSADYWDGTLAITPSALNPAALQTFGDHRMATAAAILGLGVEGIEVDDINTTSKTLPDFPMMWTRLLAQDHT